MSQTNWFDHIIGLMGVLWFTGFPVVIAIIFVVSHAKQWYRKRLKDEFWEGIQVPITGNSPNEYNYFYVKSMGDKGFLRKTNEIFLELWAQSKNLGTRISAYAGAETDSLEQLINKRSEPRVIYAFSSKRNAENALSKLPFIKKIGKHIVSEKVLSYGVYKIPSGEYYAHIGGEDLSFQTWKQVKSVFTKQKGKCVIEIPPPETINAVGDSPKVPLYKPVFKREYLDAEESRFPKRYIVFRANSAQEALKFLSEVVVIRSFVYLIVETPNGNYCRDKNGVYKE